MNVNLIPCLSDNYSYCIVNPETKQACIIDPAEFLPIDTFLNKNNLHLNYILNTHHHSDHVGANIELKNKYKCKIAGFAPDKTRIPGIDIFLEDKQLWKCLNLEFEIHHVPGHTSGHIFYYNKKENMAFVGDVVFSSGCGRIFEGSSEDMFNSINKIKKLPSETKIFCGHEYTQSNLKFCLSIIPHDKELKQKEMQVQSLRKNNQPTIPTTVGHEKKTNIFFRTNDLEIRKAINLLGASDLEIFTKLRKLKDNF
jgi:hydroxyacylglutathione hydrolase